MNWLVIVLFGIAGFLLIRYGRSIVAGIGRLLQDNTTSFMAALVILVVAVLVVVLFQPQFIVGSSGIFGSALKGSRAEANLKAYGLDPNDNPDNWPNKVAQTASGALASEYQLATAKNKAGISAAEADRLSHLPKGHPDRALWDAAKMDPAVGSLPPAVQVSKNTIGEVVENAGREIKSIDLTAMDKELSKSLGQAPANVNPVVKPTYDIPKGFVWITFLFIGVIVLGKIAISMLKALLRAPTT